MEILHRISILFDDLKTSMTKKKIRGWSIMIKRDIQSIRSELAVLGKQNQELFIRSLAMEAYLSLLSVKSLPMSINEKYNILNENFEKLKPFMERTECLFIFLRIQNLLCYYLIQLKKDDTCREILEEMEELYDKIKNDNMTRFIDVEGLFSAESPSKIKQVNLDKIDKLITNNIQMQAFLYNKMNLPEKYVVYNHTTLRRQLELRDGTPQDWALRTARLANYFTYLNQFGNACHHLCAAYHVLRSCQDTCKLAPMEFVSQRAAFETHFLELCHYWVKYGLNLFKVSKKKILRSYFSHSAVAGSDLWKSFDFDEKEECKTDYDYENMKDVDIEKNGKGDYITEQLFTFPTLDLKNMESKVPVKLVTNVEEARKLFMFTHKWLMRAKSNYSFEIQTARYTACILQLAEMLEHLAFFENKIDKQYSIQKRRADVLENLNSLLKSCDNMIPVQIDVIRELSQVQLELMALNLQKLWYEESQTNMQNDDNESALQSLGSISNKTLTRNVNVSSKNLFLRKMEAAVTISSKLFRLSGMLAPRTSSQFSFGKN